MKGAAERVLGFALVMMLVMSVVGLSASQTFTNKTGKAVTGITIEFSKRVTITRHDSVFPDQSPSGRSDEFTFDAGSLRNLGRFTVTWMPSSGKVTDYEWIEKRQPSEEQQSSTQQNEESSLPDPNTPAILYGNNYPGPDEPQYQPAPNEQIWLTDLDGHGDIYDNDSIKINYAPGFDESQIEKIDVYRNGIKLRFVPEKFDVLTNAQMKTFDGNPAEHSPASRHTDHAIMGYEYKFKISTADHLWILTKTVKSGFRWRPKEMWAEIDTTWPVSMERLSDNDILAFFKELKHDGFTGISVDVDYYMNNIHENSVFALESRNNNIAQERTIRTPSLPELERVFKAITKACLDIHVRGQIYLSQEYLDKFDNGWSACIDPTKPTTFFDNYTRLWLELIPTLNEYNVRLLTPFTEMDSIEQYSDLIMRMYSLISDEFEGEMGFEEGIHYIVLGRSPINDYRISTSNAFELFENNHTFWAWKDSQGGRPIRIEFGCWALPLETQKDQRVSVMEANFCNFFQIPVKYFNSTYPTHLQMFGEIGVYNADGSCLGPSFYTMANKKIDNQEVADIWCTYLTGAEDLGTSSINIWVIPLGDIWTDGPGDSYLNIGLKNNESPAYRIIKAIIAPEGD